MNTQKDRVVLMDYTNWQGKRSMRRVRPLYIYFGTTKYHTEPQWLLKGFDVDKQDWRRYTMRDIHNWSDIFEEEKENSL